MAHDAHHMCHLRCSFSHRHHLATRPPPPPTTITIIIITCLAGDGKRVEISDVGWGGVGGGVVISTSGGVVMSTPHVPTQGPSGRGKKFKRVPKSHYSEGGERREEDGSYFKIPWQELKFKLL